MQHSQQGSNVGSKGSWVWLKGVMCSPARLPLALIFSLRGGLKSIRRMNPPRPQDWTVLALGIGSFLAICVTVSLLDAPMKDLKKESWFASLIYNLISYSAIFLPGFLILKYVTKTQFLETGPKLLTSSVRLCFYGNNEDTIDESIESLKDKGDADQAQKDEWKRALHLLGCFVGLQFSYLTWGVLQEKIMTRQYVDSTGKIGQFKDSQFLVFVNRIMAFAVALLCIMATKQPKHKAPLYKYSYCSFSNIMSSWCQYEALKFISFPTQVLAKASKIIPVMAMGYIVSKKTYEKYEYIVALLISCGMFLFLYGSPGAISATNSSTTTSFSGLILLIGYMTSDAFTSNWQKELYDTYKISPFQAMCGVNLFSCLLTSVSLMQQGAFFDSLVFMSQFPKFTFDCVILSFCSAFGQVFIYHTIKVFGPVVFVIIMTLRQAIAILLSCYLYGHVITVIGAFGVAVVFMATFLNIYGGYQKRRRPKTSESTTSVQTKEQNSA